MTEEENKPKKRWYVVQAYSQYESRVKKTLLEYIKMHGMEDYFGQVLVPTEEVVEMRAGQKRKSERKFYPGYVLVEMEMNEDSWHLVKSVPRVLGSLAVHQTVLCQFLSVKPMPFLTVWKSLLISQSRKHCSNQAKWCGLSMAHLPISTVW